MDPVIVFRDYMRCILVGHADGFYWFITEHTEQRYAQNPKHDKWAGAQGVFFVA